MSRSSVVPERLHPTMKTGGSEEGIGALVRLEPEGLSLGDRFSGFVALFSEERPVGREVDAEEIAQSSIFATEDPFEAGSHRVFHRRGAAGRQVELSKVVNEALQDVRRLRLRRIREIVFGARFYPRSAVVEQKLEAGPAGNGRLVLVSIRGRYVYGGLQPEKRTHLVDDRLGVVDEPFEKNNFDLASRKNVEVAL